MKRIVYLIALCMSWALTLQLQAANVVPQTGVYYNIVQLSSNLVLGAATSTQPAVQTPTNSFSQAFEFVPVEGKTDTYYIKSFYGMYLNKVTSSGWNVIYQSAPNGTNSEWVITDDAGSTSSFRLLLNFNSKYLASDGTTDNSYLYCDKAITHANGLFSLTATSLPSDLISAYNGLTLGNISAVTGDLNLPATTGNNIPVSWASSQPTVISTTGAVTRPDQYDATVKLTATMSQTVNDVVYTLNKEFTATVKAFNVAAEQLAQWDFATDMITLENGAFKVKDQKSGFVGTVMNEARIRTIGSTDKFNVLDLGNEKGYFDMGTDIGKAIYSLTNYTMCGYFRIDDDYSELGSNGNFMWTFSNSADVPTDRNGYIIGSLKDQSQSISTSYWAAGNQAVSAGVAPTKGSWHHLAYTQKGDTGTIYVDGVQAATGSISNIPSTAITISGRTGTLYNWLGRSNYPSDVYLRKTLLYDFQVLTVALTGDDLNFGEGFEVTSTIDKLNAAYIENPDNILPELNAEMENLSLSDLSAVTSNLTLPTKGALDQSISITWKSNHMDVIDVTGVVTRPNYNPFNVTLTATLAKNGQSVAKTFAATVLPNAGSEFTSDLLVKYDFSTVSNDTIVTDAAEKHFTGVLKNDAKIRAIGTAESGVYNVLALGDSIGYFDMGTEVGKLIYNLNDYTVGAYFRIDADYTALASNGNFLWNFSNSKDIINDATGYIIGSLKNQAITITPTNWTAEQAVTGGSAALQGGWHHIAYTQSGTTGKVYVDGMEFASGEVTLLPATTMMKDQRTGTLYNWIGRSCYTGDVYLRKTLVHDFRLYKTALNIEQIQSTVLNVSNHISALEAAYAANTGTAVKSVKESYYKVVASEGVIRIQGLTGDEKVTVFDITGRQFRVISPSEIALNAGVYIVKVNGDVTKVAVK